MDGVREEMCLEFNQFRGEIPKEVPPEGDTSSCVMCDVGDGRGSAASEPLGIDIDHRGKAHNVYVPPPVRDVRDFTFPSCPIPTRDLVSIDYADWYSYGVHLEFPRFDGANPRLWNNRWED
ncbi:hypothetical protein D1007_53363 [Hordeum vulgare]|nr:hypothetical protein D1007_53363 [Hordeum vulgare]